MTESEPSAQGRQFSTGRVLSALAWICALCLIALGTWSSYWADLRNDQYQLINLGQCVYDGGRMYVDCWENKPPGIAWLNALGLLISGGRQIGAWLLPGVVLLLCLAVMGWAMRQLLSPAASVAAILLGSIVATLRLYDTPSINPDFYSAMFELAAGSVYLVSLHAARTRRRVALAVIAGLVWAAAVTVKQTGCVGLLSVTLVALFMMAFKRPDRSRWAAVGGMAWIGFAAGLGGVVAVLAGRGTLSAAWEAVFTFNRSLFSWGDALDALTSWPRQYSGLGSLQLPLFLALLGAIATFRAGRANGMARPVVTAMLLWWIAQALLALLGPSRSMRYWQATLPAMFWLAGVGVFHIETLFEGRERGSRVTLAIMSAALLLLLGKPLADHYRHGLATSYLAYAEPRSQRNRLKEAGRQLAEIVPEGRRIYVWAYDAGVYLYTSRRSACRFTYPRSAGQMEEILADLVAGKAFAIVISSRPSPYFDRWCDASCRQERRDALSRYELGATIDHYEVWVRSSRDDPGEPPPSSGPSSQ
jgi:hypothetical protein